MSVKDIVDTGLHAVQAVAIVLGGGWAYAKYVRGRTFRGRAQLEVRATPLTFAGDHIVAVSASMKNQGLSRIRFGKPKECILFVDRLPPSHWRPDVNVFWDEQHPAMIAPLFTDHDWIEPGETICEELLVPVAPDGGPVPLALQVRAWVRVPRRWRKKRIQWSANAIVPVAMIPGGTTTKTTTD